LDRECFAGLFIDADVAAVSGDQKFLIGHVLVAGEARQTGNGVADCLLFFGGDVGPLKFLNHEGVDDLADNHDGQNGGEGDPHFAGDFDIIDAGHGDFPKNRCGGTVQSS